MHLSQLQISKFKSIQSLSLAPSGLIDVFIGKNNSGKSNILEAAMIFLHEQKYSESLFDVKNASIDAKFLFTKQELDPGPAGSTREVMLHCALRPGQKKSFLLDNQTISQEKAQALLQKYAVHIDTSRVLVEKRRDVNAQIEAGDISIFFAQEAFEELSSEYPESYGEMLAALSNMFPELSFKPDSQLFRKVKKLKYLYETTVGSQIFEGDELRTIANLGSGYLKIAVMLLFLYHPRYHLVIIDEPENHLHIGLQKKLYQVMQEVSQNKHILISTHSPLFVTPETFSSLHRTVKTLNGTSVYPDYTEPQNAINITRLAQELNLESSEMLFADHVILVEGAADEILIGGLIDRFYEGQQEILVLPVHSNTNFKIYRNVLQYFHISYTIVTDKDSLRGPIDIIQEIFGPKPISGGTQQKKIAELKKHHIYVLSSGALEYHYPRKYQKNYRTKPLNALDAAKNITPHEFDSLRMLPLHEIIESIT